MAAPPNKPPGHFDRFNFCVCGPDLTGTDVNCDLLPAGINAHFVNVGAGTVQTASWCEPDPLHTVTSFTCDAAVDNPAVGMVTYQYAFQSPGPNITNVALGVMQPCTGHSVPFGTVELADGTRHPVTDITTV
jgi:hypothetical protein